MSNEGDMYVQEYRKSPEDWEKERVCATAKHEAKHWNISRKFSPPGN
jgi:hypothetical protein